MMDTWAQHVWQMGRRTKIPTDVYANKNNSKGLGPYLTNFPPDVNFSQAKTTEGTYGKVYIWPNRVIKAPKYSGKDDDKKGIDVQLLKELVALQNLDHPNLLKMTAWYRIRGQLYMEMPNCGVTLLRFQELVCKQKQIIGLPDELIREIMTQLLEAVSYMHTHGYIHLDLKEDNMLVKTVPDPDKPGQSKIHVTVIDFSLSEWIGVECQISDFYKQATWHRAPEICLGIPYTYSADIWSIGCILFYMMETRYLFTTTEEKKIRAEYIRIFGKPTDQDWLDGSIALELSNDLCDAEMPASAREDRAANAYVRLKDQHGFNMSSIDDVFGEIMFQKAPAHVQYIIRRLYRQILQTKPGALIVDMLARCWQMNPDHRSTAKELLCHPFIGKGIAPAVGLMTQNYLHLILPELCNITTDDSGIFNIPEISEPAEFHTEVSNKSGKANSDQPWLVKPVLTPRSILKNADSLTPQQVGYFWLIEGAMAFRMNADSIVTATWILSKINRLGGIDTRSMNVRLACLVLGAKMHDEVHKKIYTAYAGTLHDICKQEFVILGMLGGDLQQTSSTVCLRTYLNFLNTLLTEAKPDKAKTTEWRKNGESLLALLTPCLLHVSPDVVAMGMLHFLAPDWTRHLQLFTGLKLEDYAHISLVISKLIVSMRDNKQIGSKMPKMFHILGRKLGMWE